MLSQSFWELFHSDSKSAIWNKQELNLSSYINWNEVSNLVDWGQLDLLEKKHLNLIDTKPLVTFVQYVGAFSSVFLLLGSFSLRVALDQYIYSRNLAFEHAQTYSYASVPSNQMEVSEAVLGVSTSNDTYDYRDSVWNEDTSVFYVEDEYVEAEPMVFEEVYVEDAIVEETNEAESSFRTMTRSNLCSFSYGDTMYASGATVNQNQVSNEICIKKPNSISNISARLLGGLSGEDNLSLNGSGCVKLGTKAEVDSSKLNVEMYDENNLKVGNCELVFASL